MNESIGGSGLFYIVIIIISALLLLMLGFLSFSKAFKVKNNIVNSIHENKGNIDFDDIESDLISSGYSSKKSTECDKTYLYRKLQSKKEEQNASADIGEGKDSLELVIGSENVVSTYSTSFDYCVYKYNFGDGSYYYSVITYVHMNIPLINEIMHIPVIGETKIFNRKYE